MIDDKVLQNLSKNLLEILEDDEYYDIIIEVGSDPYKNDGTLTHIKLPNILPETFQVILRYIYGGVVSWDEYDASDIIKILVSASELNLQELIILVQFYLIENKSEWIELNFNDVYQTSFGNNSFSELQKYCNDLTSKAPDKIFRSLDLSSTSEKVIISLIQSENIQIRAIQVWDYIIKWGYAQNSELPSDLKNFSEEDFNILKNSLQKCISYVNFHNLTSAEFLDKVLPYKKILSDELLDHLIHHFMNPSNRPEENNSNHIDSKIITFQHAELILKWINTNSSSTYTSIFRKWIYKDTTDTTQKLQNFKLLLRGTRDGFTPEKFHEICDDQSHTVTIVKLQDSNEILGGYNPIAWKSGQNFDTAKDSFIFSFKDNNNIENHILSRVKFEWLAVYNFDGVGSSFGGADLTLNNEMGSCSQWAYENPIRETNDTFFCAEYEVFQITSD
ncbi:carbohydrate-binding module family 13 protein [Rhizophagus clarus]|uniref:Carbohydrate-binding module family 13 protein n=1 Tax=Rhizophagus clarus TaxID=94130 RepID=A0A8H3M6J1_9GLOM|nr:carbohydrate-binding module family 13 protein [Rhizophagus clarus]